MSDPFVAEIRIFPFNFAPRGWAFCNGQLLPISQNTALFSLLGTYYGGDGKSTFGLPDLQGSAPLGAGQGPGLSDYFLGQVSGAENVTLLQSEIPSHSHALNTYNDIGEDRTPNTTEALARSTGGSLYGAPGPVTQMAPSALVPYGGSLPHNNMQPYLTLSFCIAMQGIFPPRG
ncbi:MAG: phage tail protein [Burkholderiales bacterium]|nr:phage tail protein [Burkholderiales bacterium]